MTRFYVTMTWHDWPEGGSYGTVVNASTPEQAIEACKHEMACSRAEGITPEFDPEDTEEPDFDPAEWSSEPEYWLKTYGNDWHLVDCFNLDEFIERHKK